MVIYTPGKKSLFLSSDMLVASFRYNGGHITRNDLKGNYLSKEGCFSAIFNQGNTHS